MVSFLGGQGVEYWYNGLSRFPSLAALHTQAGHKEAGYVEVEQDEINGEKVEMEMTRERKVQRVRSLVAGIGFAMAVVGIWGDGV